MERTRCAIDSFVLLICIMHMDAGRAATCSGVEYNIGGKCCPLCPSGNHVSKHCTQEAGTSCVSCTEGTFMDKPNGRTNCFPCNICSAGLKVKTPCRPTSDAVCEQSETQKHSSCRPGQYIVQRGTSSTDTKCADCTGDTYSDGTFTTCQPHTKCESIGRRLRKPGNQSNDSRCETWSSHFATVFVGVFVGVVIGGVLSAVNDVRRFGVVGVVGGGAIGLCSAIVYDVGVVGVVGYAVHVFYVVAGGVSCLVACIVGGVYNLVSGIVGGVYNLVSGIVGGVYNLVSGIVGGVCEEVVAVLCVIFRPICGVVGFVYNLVSGVVGFVYDLVSGVVGFVQDLVSGVVGGVYGLVGGVLSLCAGCIVSVVEVCVAVINGLFATISAVSGLIIGGGQYSVVVGCGVVLGMVILRLIGYK